MSISDQVFMISFMAFTHPVANKLVIQVSGRRALPEKLDPKDKKHAAKCLLGLQQLLCFFGHDVCERAYSFSLMEHMSSIGDTEKRQILKTCVSLFAPTLKEFVNPAPKLL